MNGEVTWTYAKCIRNYLLRFFFLLDRIDRVWIGDYWARWPRFINFDANASQMHHSFQLTCRFSMSAGIRQKNRSKRIESCQLNWNRKMNGFHFFMKSSNFIRAFHFSSFMSCMIYLNTPELHLTCHKHFSILCDFHTTNMAIACAPLGTQEKFRFFSPRLT